MKKELIIGSVAAFALDSMIFLIMETVQFSLLTHVMEWFSHLITVVFLLVIVSSYMLIQQHKKQYAILVAVSFVGAFICSQTIKLLVMRIRPSGLEYMSIYLGNMLLHIPDYSFPSSHSAIAFSVLPLLDHEFRNIKMLWIFIACMIAVSRLYLGVHYFSDVVIGAIIGYGVGYFMLQLENKYAVAKKLVGP